MTSGGIAVVRLDASMATFAELPAVAIRALHHQQDFEAIQFKEMIDMTIRTRIFMTCMALAIGLCPLASTAGETVEVSREKMLATLEANSRSFANLDREGILDTFAADAKFMNSALEEPLQGREALRSFMEQWRWAINTHEWQVIEGNRLVVGWNERPRGSEEGSPVYRGIASFVFNEEGLIQDYDCIFDKTQVHAVYRAFMATQKP